MPGERLAALGDRVDRPLVGQSRWWLDEADLHRLTSKCNAAAFSAFLDSELVVEMQEMLLHRGVRYDQLSGHLLHRGRLRDDVFAEQRSAKGSQDIAFAPRQIRARR